MLPHDDRSQKLLERELCSYEWLAAVATSLELVDANVLDAHIARLSELLTPFTREKFDKYGLAFACLNELYDLKARHTTFVADYYDSISMEDCATETSDVTTSSSGDPAPEVDLTLYLHRFGIREMRGKQPLVVAALLAKKDCLAVLPTGEGKSLCFQLPALVNAGVTIVICPLVALMIDQVKNLKKRGIDAEYLNGTLGECDAIFANLGKHRPDVKLLYVTPERLVNALEDNTGFNRFRNMLLSLYKRNLLVRFVVDEAHCVPQWGHEFRAHYLKLYLLRTLFPAVCIVALTATATLATREEIKSLLHLRDPCEVIASCRRDNLVFTVVSKTTKIGAIEDIGRRLKTDFSSQSGIVYCFSKTDCEWLAMELCKLGIPAEHYHSDVTYGDRVGAYSNWMTGKTLVMCATLSFGMGIDKPDVRFVMHLTMPKSMEGYYQECGRAGRDGHIAHCILYYRYYDSHHIRVMVEKGERNAFGTFPETETLQEVMMYCENTTSCRMSLILQYFGESCVENVCLRSALCDNCRRSQCVLYADVTAICRAVVDLIGKPILDWKGVSITLLVDVLRGSKGKATKDSGLYSCHSYGLLAQWSDSEVSSLVRFMILRNYLSDALVLGSLGKVNGYLQPGWKAVDAKIVFPRSRVNVAGASFAPPGNAANCEPMDIDSECSDDDFVSASYSASRIPKKRKLHH
ncbi:Bloom syndrome protein homolog [Daphnia pulicaria]|uniref:Bloom syndrome protein homolog n=1 Tax=Daphnia pulicaria TaxID=35523 RepID=UPI001EEC08F0|nr:Bloom syndrome protein homolog [Daphnia pulicaria]